MEYFIYRLARKTTDIIEERFVLILFGMVLISGGLMYINPYLAILPVFIYIGAIGLRVVSNNRILFPLGIFVVNENLFYILNRNMLPYIYDLRQLVGVILAGLLIIYLPRIIKTKMLFKRDILVLIGYFFFSVIWVYINLGQKLMSGIYSYYFYLGFISYFILCFWIQDPKTFQKFKEYYVYLSGASGLIYIVQSLVYPSIVFLTTDFRYRYSRIRFTEFSVYMVMALYMTLNMLLENQVDKKRKQVIFIISLAIQFYTIFLIAQNRMMSVMVILTLVIMLIKFQNRIDKRYIRSMLVLGSLSVIIAVIILFNNGAEDNIILDTINEVITLSGNTEARYNSVMYYYHNLEGKWLLGWGMLNGAHTLSYWTLGTFYDHYLVDVGFFGFIYQFGIVGFILTFTIMIRGAYKAYQLYKMDNTIYYPLMGKLLIIFMFVQVYFYFEYTAIFNIGLWFAFIEFETKIVEVRKRNEDFNGITMSDSSTITRESNSY